MITATLLCLTQAIYFEARGEPLSGQYMVAAVVLNRAASKKYSDDVCKVVFQKSQFEFTTRASLKMTDPVAKATAEFIAKDMLETYEPNTTTLWFYNPTKASPGWAKRLDEEIIIGKHRFMRSRKDV